MLLCLPAEPHTDSWPCARHFQEARHQVLSTPRLQPAAGPGTAEGTEGGRSGYWV